MSEFSDTYLTDVKTSLTQRICPLLVLLFVSTMKLYLPCCGRCTVSWTARPPGFFMKSSSWTMTVTLVRNAVTGSVGSLLWLTTVMTTGHALPERQEGPHACSCNRASHSYTPDSRVISKKLH